MAPMQTRLMGPRVRRALGGLLLGGLLLVVYFDVVGVGEVRRVLWTVPPERILSLLVVGGVPLVLWGLGLHLVFDQLGVSIRYPNSVLLYAASGFLNAITPFGQAGGDPVTAVLFGRALGTDFETGLAAIGSLNALNRVAAVVLGLLGVGYLGSRVTVGGDLRNAAVLVTGLSIAVALGLVVGWRYRHRLVSVLASVLTPLLRGSARLVPGVTPPTREGIERRSYRFIGAIDRLASDPRRLAVVFALSIAGQLAVAASLWIALAALGSDAPIAVVLLIIPIGKLAGVAPTPGGFGSSEALLAVLLISTTGVTGPVAGGAVLLYRASAFWLPSLVGGLVTGWAVVVGNASGTDPDRPRPVAGGCDGTLHADRDESIPPPGQSTVPRILTGLAVSLAVLVTVAVHRSHLVVEPNSIVVHAVRDTSLVVLSFVLTWALLRRLPRGWLG